MKELISKGSLHALAGIEGQMFLAIAGPGLTDHKIAEILYVVTEGKVIEVRANLVEYDPQENLDDGCEMSVMESQLAFAERFMSEGKMLAFNARQLIKKITVIRHNVKGLESQRISLDYVTDVAIHFELEIGSFALVKTSYHDELLCVAYDVAISEIPNIGSRYVDSVTEHFETSVQALTIEQALTEL